MCPAAELTKLWRRMGKFFSFSFSSAFILSFSILEDNSQCWRVCPISTRGRRKTSVWWQNRRESVLEREREREDVLIGFFHSPCYYSSTTTTTASNLRPSLNPLPPRSRFPLVRLDSPRRKLILYYSLSISDNLGVFFITLFLFSSRFRRASSTVPVVGNEIWKATTSPPPLGEISRPVRIQVVISRWMI